MAKTFAPRVSKKNRKKIDLSDKLDRDLFKISDARLLGDAKLDEIQLKMIKVRDQVRTKFNDSSIKELAENIKSNGLIQPLVLHRINGKLTLICGERRYRAMTLNKMKKAPCFILEGKSSEELMAIQFSENSSRESLHYIDKADGILNYQKATNDSERKIQAALGISKSDVHRSLIVAKLPKRIKEAAKKHDIEKYVLVEFSAIDSGTVKKSIEKQLISGAITKRSQLKKALSGGKLVKASRKKSSTPRLPNGLTASAFLKAMNSKTKEMKMDAKTKKLLKSLIDETKEIVDI